MPQLVQVGDDVVQFPDNFSHAQIEEVLRRERPPKEAPAPLTESEVRQAIGGPFGPVPRSGEELAAQTFALRQQAAKNLGLRGLMQEGIPGTEPLDVTLPGDTRLQFPGGGFQPFPRVQPPQEAGATEKIAAGVANVAGGLGNFFLTPEGAGTMMVPGLLGRRLGSLALGAVFAPQLTKSAAQLAGEASVTKDPQTITEAALTGVMGAGAATPIFALSGRLGQIARAKRLLPNAAAEAEKGVITDASRIREDERQVRAQDELQGRPGEGRPDLEQPAPGEPGRPAPRREAKAPEEGLPGVLLDNRPAIKLMPEKAGEKPRYIDAELTEKNEWETHDQIIERADLNTAQIDRRVFRDRLGTEKSREEVEKELAAFGVTTKVPGEAHSTDVNKLAAEPAAAAAAPKVYTLDPGKKLPGPVVHPEIDPVLDAERAAIDNPIDVVANPTDPNDPFAARRGYRPGQFMGINRERGTVEIYPQELEAWLREDVPQGRWNEAVRARLAEESIHLRTTPDDAVRYWNGLSFLERYAEGRIYLGKNWQARMAPGGEFTVQDLGFEAIRRRIQRLDRMSSSEAAEAAKRERWTVKGLETLSDVVRKMREGLGTKASAEQRAIIDRIAGNLDAAKAALGQPGAIRKTDKDWYRAALELKSKFGWYTPEEVEKYSSVGPEMDNLKPGEAQKEYWRARAAELVAKSDKIKPEQAYNDVSDWERNQGINLKKWVEENAPLIEGPRQMGLDLPAAIRKDKGTPEMYMPPVARGEQVERGGFPLPTGIAVREIAEALWSDLSKVTSLEEFRGQVEGRFGSLKPEPLFDAWQDAMIKRLMTAKGSEIDALMDKLNLRGDVAKALKPGEAAPILSRGKIPDALEMPATQMSLAEIEQFFKQRQWKTKAAFRQKFGPEQRRRYAAIGEIVGKLAEEAGGKPKTPTTRSEIGPEDVSHVMQVVKGAERIKDPETGLETMSQPEVESLPAWYTFKPEDMKDAGALGKFAVQGARVRPTTKFTVSNNIMALRGPGDKIYVVSVWNDTRTGPKVTNPQGEGLTARNIDDKLLREYRPMVLARLRNPLERFRQVFDTPEAFDRHFGDIGIEGTTGLGTSMFVGPQAGAARAQAGLTGAGRPPSAEARLPQPFRTKPPLLQASPLISGARELTLPRFARRSIPGGELPEPAPRPTPPEMLPGAQPMPPVPTEPMFRKLPYETLPRPSTDRPVTEYGTPAPRQPGSEIRAGLDPRLARRAPAAVRKIAGELDLVRRDLVDMVKAKPTEQRIVNGIDSAGNKANNLANQKENRVRFASAQRPPTFLERAKGRWQMGKPEVLAAANVLVESVYDPARAMWRGFALRLHTNVGDFDPRAIPIFRFEIDRGRRRAEARLRSTDYRVQEIAKSELRAYDQYKKELDYAEAHWNDPELQETARRLRAAYNEQYRELVKRGVNVSLEPGFNPHRYDAAVWNGHSYIFNMSRGARKVLGERTLANRTFDSYYHAFGNDAFLPITRDSASLLGHYIRRTNHLMFREEWRDTLKSMKLPNGEELAADPKQMGKRALPHKLNYVLVHDGGNGLSVHQDYAKLVQRLVDPSAFEASPVLKSALSLSQQLKHTLLAGDFFHLGRMLYYANAVMGTKMGYQAGWSVLDIAPRDVPEAVRKGIIRQADADWANQMIALPRGRSMTRRQVVEKFYQEMGSNLGRVQDALYKDLVTAVQPTSGPVRRAFVALADPSVGRYNRFLFDRLTRGFMAESVAREFERQMKANPNVKPKALMRDIARDVNNFFGNIGRQGWVQSKTFQDMNRLLWLAPQWVEGLIKKEAVGYGRLTGASKALGIRQGPQQGYVRQLGTMGYAIGRGMLMMAAITQAINLITRRQPTWMNEEKEHKWDAWIPGRGADSEGFWFSPLAIFNEVSHDIYRLAMSKPTFADAITQIMGNKEQPVTRAVLVGLTGQSPMGQRITTTGGRLKEVGKAVVPVPISFGRVSQYGLSKVGAAPPPPPGSVQRQIFATLGIKIEPHGTAVQQVATLARDFMRESGLEKTTGWQQIQTDEPGYSKLRAALRAGDDKAAKRNLDALLKNRSEKDIMAAMKAWKDRGFTGSKKAEREFMHSLSDKQMDLYDKAHEQKQLLWEKWLDWFYRQE